MFLQLHDMNDGNRMLVNHDDVAYIEERSAGCMVRLKTIASDFDQTIHQVSLYVSEDYDAIWKQLDSFSKVSWAGYTKREEKRQE